MKLSQIVSRDPNLNHYFEQVQKKYLDSHQLAFYTNPNQHQKSYMINGGIDQDGDHVFMFFGVYQDSHIERQERLYLIVVSWLEKQFKAIKNKDVKSSGIPKFSIVFYNTLSSSSAFSSFKQIIKKLPLLYLDQLKRIIVVDAGFTNKFYGWISTGTLNGYLYNHINYIDGTGDLPRYGISPNKQFKTLLPGQILQEQRMKSQGMCFQRDALIEDQQNPIKVKLANQTKTPNHKIPYKNRLEDYDLTASKTPVLLKLLISHLTSNPAMLESPGIFRKSVAIDDQQEIDQYLSHKDYNYISKINDPYLIASVIVRIFKFLKQPIIPIGVYHKLVTNVQQDNIEIKVIRNLLSQIPRINQINLFYLISFMKNEVVSRQEVNKMTSYNIAAVLMPCLMRSENPILDMVHAKKCVKILEFIINNYSELASERGAEKQFQSLDNLKGGADYRFSTNLSSTYDQGSYRNSGNINENTRKTHV